MLMEVVRMVTLLRIINGPLSNSKDIWEVQDSTMKKYGPRLKKWSYLPA